MPQKKGAKAKGGGRGGADAAGGADEEKKDRIAIVSKENAAVAILPSPVVNIW